MRNRRINTEWIEVGAGILLFAHLAGGLIGPGAEAYARSLAFPFVVFGISISFVMRSLLRRRFVYLAGIIAVTAALAAAGAFAWTGGHPKNALLFLIYAAGYAACHLLKRRKWQDDALGPLPPADTELSMPAAVAGTFLAAAGLHGLFGGGAASAAFAAFLVPSWAFAAATAAVGIAAASAGVVGFRGAGRLQIAAGAWLLALSFGQVSADSHAAALVGATFGLIVIFDRLVRRPHVVPEGLAAATEEQKQVYAHEEVGNANIWIIIGWSGVYFQFMTRIEPFAYLVALGLAIAIVVAYYHFAPIRAYNLRSYHYSLLGLAIAFSAYMAGTGGLFSPFALFYAVIVLAAAVLPPGRALMNLAVLQAYFLFELARAVVFSEDAGSSVAQFVFLSAGLATSSLYAVILSRRRQQDEATLRKANADLARALDEAVRERKAYQVQASEALALNEDLREMRSALMNVLEDVEESKLEIELERRRETASFNAIGEGVVATERDGRIFLCNPTAGRILGIEPQDVLGKPVDAVLRLFREDSDVLETGPVMRAFAGTSGTLTDKLVLLRADGRRVPIAGTIAPFMEEGGLISGVVLAFRDVTIEREIDRQKSDFISIASHQLRTPLSAIRWFMDLLLAGDAGALKPKQKEFLDDIHSSTIRMSRLVNDLLNVSRIESGKLKLNREWSDARALIEASAKDQLPFMKQKRIRFEIDMPDKLPRVWIDQGMVRQVLENVLTNALKYTLEGGTITVRASVAGTDVIIEIIDSGLGIPRHQQHRVFDKFFRGDNVLIRETVGTGLGLYLAKTVMDLSGGRIWFESEEGKGTRFFVALPGKELAQDRGAG